MSIFSAGVIMGLGLGLVLTSMLSLSLLRREPQKVPLRLPRRARRALRPVHGH
jgi:hypothetical protein